MGKAAAPMEDENGGATNASLDRWQSTISAAGEVRSAMCGHPRSTNAGGSRLPCRS